MPEGCPAQGIWHYIISFFVGLFSHNLIENRFILFILEMRLNLNLGIVRAPNFAMFACDSKDLQLQAVPTQLVQQNTDIVSNSWWNSGFTAVNGSFCSWWPRRHTKHLSGGRFQWMNRLLYSDPNSGATLVFRGITNRFCILGSGGSCLQYCITSTVVSRAGALLAHPYLR